jgi:iron complex transport system permease protein
MLKNALASPYILGISAGASLGTALVMLTGFVLPVIGTFTLPAAGFVFALGTVIVVLACAAKLDSTLSSNTVILFGMVFSLFVNAILTVTVSMFHEELKTLVLWQMGSFALKGWPYLRLLLPFVVVGGVGVFREHRALDLLSFSDDEAASLGVETRIVRPRLFFLAALLTGATVALCGAIGFVDLIAPHLARRLVGPRHCYALPLSFLLGGTLLVASDLVARRVLSPSELPVGAVTALLGAPFFVVLYFRKGRSI